MTVERNRQVSARRNYSETAVCWTIRCCLPMSFCFKSKEKEKGPTKEIWYPNTQKRSRNKWQINIEAISLYLEYEKKNTSAIVESSSRRSKEKKKHSLLLYSTYLECITSHNGYLTQGDFLVSRFLSFHFLPLSLLRVSSGHNAERNGSLELVVMHLLMLLAYGFYASAGIYILEASSEGTIIYLSSLKEVVSSSSSLPSIFFFYPLILF